MPIAVAGWLANPYPAHNGIGSKETAMKCKWIIAATVIVPLMQISWSAQAFECPAHFAEAQMAIDKADERIKHMKNGMPLAAISHLRHARMSLVEARFHHAQSGNFHHARAIVRANEALGHAIVANIVSQKLVKK